MVEQARTNPEQPKNEPEQPKFCYESGHSIYTWNKNFFRMRGDGRGCAFPRIHDILLYKNQATRQPKIKLLVLGPFLGFL